MYFYPFILSTFIQSSSSSSSASLISNIMYKIGVTQCTKHTMFMFQVLFPCLKRKIYCSCLLITSPNRTHVFMAYAVDVDIRCWWCYYIVKSTLPWIWERERENKVLNDFPFIWGKAKKCWGGGFFKCSYTIIAQLWHSS